MPTSPFASASDLPCSSGQELGDVVLVLEDEGVQAAQDGGPFRRGLRPPGREGPRGRLDGALRLLAAAVRDRAEKHARRRIGDRDGVRAGGDPFAVDEVRALHQERVLEDGLVEHVSSPAA